MQLFAQVHVLILLFIFTFACLLLGYRCVADSNCHRKCLVIRPGDVSTRVGHMNASLRLRKSAAKILRPWFFDL